MARTTPPAETPLPKKVEPHAFLPFADDVVAQTIGGLTLENGTARIALHGSLDLTRDRVGLARARALQVAITAIVTALASEGLPEAVAEEAIAPEAVKNPFA